MPITLPTLVLSNFLLMGALPTVFFRRGTRFKLMWWVTAAPFLLGGRLVAMARSGEIQPWIHYSQSLATLLDSAAVVCSAASIALILAAWRAHRRPPALWHQDDDQPPALLTGGVYGRVRHPLYAAYLLALVAAALAVPHPLSALALSAGWLLLELTAQREERRLCASPFGAEYAAYMDRSGRFWPRWLCLGRLPRLSRSSRIGTWRP